MTLKMTDHDLIYILALQHVPKIGDITAKKLISHCGSAEAVLKEPKSNLLKIGGIGTTIISDLFNSSHLIEAEKELQFTKDNEIECLYFSDKD